MTRVRAIALFVLRQGRRGCRSAHAMRLSVALAAVAGCYQLTVSAQDTQRALDTRVASLGPTAHPVLPGDPTQYLFVPTPGSGAAPDASTAGLGLARAVRLIADGESQAALALLQSNALAASPLSSHARYYTAVALRNLKRLDDAESVLAALVARRPVGYLEQASAILRAEVAIARQQPQQAVAALEAITISRVASPEQVLARLGAAAEQSGDTEKALRVYRRLYFEFPLSGEAEAAGVAINRLQLGRPGPLEVLPLERARAEALFAARRWAQAREAFANLITTSTRDEDRELATLRVAECDVNLNRARQARDVLQQFAEQGTRQVEAQYYEVLSARALDLTSYEADARRFVQEHPQSAWAEDVLNGLATYYIVNDNDEAADEMFRTLLTRFPTSRYAERAAWKVGWSAYRAGRFSEAATVFEAAAADAPRADFRPAWIYWAGRAHDQVEETAAAAARYRLTATDYLNSYYGRLAVQRLAERRDTFSPAPAQVAADAMPSPLIPTDLLVRQLVGLGLYDDALRELEYAQRAWGDSAAIQATTAWIRHHRAAQLASMERFQSLRGAINQMKRAYPQYLAAGGEDLPPEVLKVIFPLDYWPLISAEAQDRSLDPYLMAALVAQESTFTADIRSGANAYGLMQLIPSTGRRYANKVGLRGFSTAALTRPETNVRLGMTYFKDLMDRFGGAHFALASYNAGESRVQRWIDERPGIPQDEFIDDIPFPETQNYVKRILGTAEDYRRLYGGGILVPGLLRPAVAVAAAPVATGRASAPTSTKKASKPAKRKSSTTRSVRSSRSR